MLKKLQTDRYQTLEEFNIDDRTIVTLQTVTKNFVSTI
jgi:hypothetical protein